MSHGVEWGGDAKSPEEILQRLGAALPVGVALVRESQLVWANDALLEISGRVSLADLIGLDLTGLLADAGEGLPDAIARPSVQCALVRPSGRRRSVRWRLTWAGIAPRTDAWAVEDVTQSQVLEHELLRAGRELHRLHRELDALRDTLRTEKVEREEMLAVVSHELRTPVTVISGYNRLLLQEEAGALSPEQRQFLEESTRSCRRLDAFLARLVEGAQMPRCGKVLEVASILLHPVLEEVSGSLRPLLAERGLRIEVRVEDEGLRARYDRGSLEQILNNLLGNAIRHSPRDAVVELSARARVEDGRPLVEVAVGDAGPGVAPADRERIFEPYVQLDAPADAGLQGLGLAICRRLVESMGGCIGVEERPGGGSRFCFTLPGAGS
jgi:signal transduction histidine kinase